MSYRKFRLEDVEEKLGLTIQETQSLFQDLEVTNVSSQL